MGRDFMRGLKRNKQKLWYQLYSEHIPVYETDLDGNIIYDPVTGEALLTGDYTVGYADPVPFDINLSKSGGRSEDEPFGIDLSAYNAKLVTCNKDLPISEGTIIWYSTKPVRKSDGTYDTNMADFKVVDVDDTKPNSNVYILKKITKGSVADG